MPSLQLQVQPDGRKDATAQTASYQGPLPVGRSDLGPCKLIPHKPLLAPFPISPCQQLPGHHHPPAALRCTAPCLNRCCPHFKKHDEK